jgi:hypothetical protein
MSSKKTLMSVAVGTAFAAALGAAPVASAASNPFAMQSLSKGYMVAEGDMPAKAHEGKCGEGKCGAKRKANEGKCGAKMPMADESKAHEGKCGAKK